MITVPSLVCEAGRTALLVALEQGHVDAVAKLIELGADVKHVDKVTVDRSLHVAWHAA